MTPPPVLEIVDLSKDYRGLRPLRMRDLTARAGESIAIIGFDQPSAEVFVGLVTGASLPDSGEVRLFGRSTRSIGDSAEWLSIVDRVGIVSDRAVLLDRFSVTQNLAMPFTLDIEPPPADVRVRAEALAEESGIPQARWPDAVAAGGAPVRTRVRLGRALALDPQLLLLEHATATLDLDEADAFGRDVKAIAIRRQIAVVCATADKRFARAVGTRVVTLDAASGRLR
jgi:ABC-type polar amino acid transport system ATPase subunit